MSDLTREQVEAAACRFGARSSANSHQRRAHDLATQLLATMDALTTAEARIEAALVVCEDTKHVASFNARIEAAAILRGDRDTKGERL